MDGPCRPHALCTAWGLLAFGALALVRAPHAPLAWSALAVGVTSVAHHRRLHTWWVDDWVRACDIAAVAALGAVAFATLRGRDRLRWCAACAYSLAVFAALSSALVPLKHVPLVHATTHAAAVAALAPYLLLR